MSLDSLLTVVAEWLEETEIPPLVRRDLIPVDLENLKRVLAIVGPRRAGKTYFMYQLIQSLLETGRYSKQDILFIDFEDYRLSGFSKDDVDALFAAHLQLAGRPPRFLFFDEVQHLQEWSRVLRTLHNRRRFIIIVSRSNSRLLDHEVATELRGRYDDVLMLPFSFREYLRHEDLSATEASLHTPARGRIVGAFDSYLRRGGFPEVIMAGSDFERRKLLQSYFNTIFYKDILERHNIKARHVLDAVMSEALETYSGLFSISQFEKHLKAKGLSCSKRTVSNYLDYLEEAFFIVTNEKFSYSSRRRKMNPKKAYLMDTGFAALGRSFSENRGRILENLVAVELYRRGEETYYSMGRHECDFIVVRGRAPNQALQVCWELTTRNEKRELAGLLEARRRLNVQSGTILTFSQEGRRTVSDWEMNVLPVWKWLINADADTSD